MKFGNWIPISKAFVKDLPLSRPYTRLEAAYSLQFDYDQKNSVTVAGYAALWSWSRTKVSKFLDDMDIEIVYPETTQKRQNQKGQIKIQIKDRSKTDKRQIRCINSRDLQVVKNRKKTDERQIKDRSKNTTKDPIYSVEIKNFTGSFQDHVLKSHKAKAPKITESLLNNCNDTIEKLIRLDGFELNYIIDSLRWAVKDSFWSVQVFSLASLRKKSDNGLTKFQNIANAYDNSLPEQPKEKNYVI